MNTYHLKWKLMSLPGPWECPHEQTDFATSQCTIVDAIFRQSNSGSVEYLHGTRDWGQWCHEPAQWVWNKPACPFWQNLVEWKTISWPICKLCLTSHLNSASQLQTHKTKFFILCIYTACKQIREPRAQKTLAQEAKDLGASRCKISP